ncbi:phage minor head protein [Nesterenkonia sp. K-15-9-6]|uniref:phage minor head protein n=1 Tax=Nesterenkonia sp. K-15-9-6 TaxID=3093918 RepID=UPI0040442BB5
MTDETRRIARLGKDQLRDLTDAQVVALTTAWVNLFDDLRPEYEDAVLTLVADHPQGATPAQAAQHRRTIEAMDLTRERLRALVDEADQRVTVDIPDAVRAGADTPVDMLRSQLPEAATAGITISFNSVDPQSLAQIITRVTSRISSRLDPLAEDMEDAIRRELTRGIAAGANPREVARRTLTRVEGAFNGGLARATRIARTEMLDANRGGSQAAALANEDLITGQLWMATLDARTCMSCIDMHGTEFPADAFGPLDHPNGRCTFIAKLRPWAELGIDAPEPPDMMPDAHEWFEGLTEDTQRAMLGPRRWELWQAGDISWGDFAVRRENPDWRAAYYERPARDLGA